MGNRNNRNNIMNILITGGAGFIGINAVKHFALNENNTIIILDNLSKKGSETNLKLVEDLSNVTFYKANVTDQEILNIIFNNKIDVVLHLAAQTAVTLSVTDPKDDFNTNVIGTFGLLETIRNKAPDCHIVYASTNKVYGNLLDIPLTEHPERYWFEEDILGVNETTNLDFYSPYGCSKGAADQYVLDYNRIYGIKSTVLRQSCIYGQFQNGTEDQGWVAWFMKAYLGNEDITVYGNGKQVRDVLYVDDLIKCYDTIINKSVTGCFNVGGGNTNTLSLIETLNWMKENISNSSTNISYDITRPGDQQIFVSDNTKLKEIANWEPTITVEQGFKKLLTYLTK